MTTNPGMDGINAIFSNKLLRDVVADQALRGLRNSGVRLGESGLEKLKDMNPSDVIGLAEQFFGGISQATAPQETEKPKPAPSPAPRSEKATPAPQPAPTPADVFTAPAEKAAKPAPVEEVTVEVVVKDAATSDAEEKKVAEALTVLEAIFSTQTPATRDTAIAAVMRLVESASGNGLTGEHATWIARLYGNHQLG